MSESKTVKHDGYDRLYSIGVWQDYKGTSWNNISTGKLPDGVATHNYPSGYKPKSLFFKFKKTYGSSVTVNNVYVVLHIACKKVKALPTLKAFVGDSNAPYKEKPNCTITTPYKYIPSTDTQSRKNGYYLAYYKLNNIAKADLKNLIIECDWSKTNATDIGVGFLALNVSNTTGTSGIVLSSTLSSTQPTIGDDVVWKITAKQYSTTGFGNYDIDLPFGINVDPVVDGGSYENGIWYLDMTKGKTASLTYTIPCEMVGMYELSAYKVNASLPRTLLIDDFYMVSEPLIEDISDVLISVPNDIHAKESGKEIDLYIKGKTTQVYGVSVTCNSKSILIPLSGTLSEEADSTNISTVTGNGDSITITPSNNNEEYYLHLKVPIYSYNSGTGTATVTHSGKTWSQNIYISEEQGFIGNIQSSKNSLERTSTISSNIGIGGIWTIRSKADYHNYYNFDDELFSLNIEDPIAYIGSVEVDRCHSSDVTSSVKNTEIKNRYLNRAYYGKKGDYSESIGMKLRIPPNDVASLQGFVEYDKPVPIDLIPARWDSDPLNHRGWAELYELNNVKKINENLYECEPVVDYITHELNTKFSVIKGDEIYPTSTDSVKYPSIHTYLSQTHNFGDDLTEIMDISPSSNQSILETEDGVGSVYNLEPKSSIKYISKNLASNYGDWNIRFRNHLENLGDEDYDSNWEMTLRLLDGETPIYEHNYHNFKHSDSEYGYNKCAVTDTIWNGSAYEVMNYENLSLNTDDLAPIVSSTKHKTAWTFSSNTFVLNEYITSSVTSAMDYTRVKLTIESVDGDYKESWDMTTDGDGKIVPNLNLQDGDYTLTVSYEETDETLGCTDTQTVTIDEDKTTMLLSYAEPSKFIATDSTFKVQIGTYVLDEDDESETYGQYIFTPTNNLDVYYGFCNVADDEYTGLQKLTSATVSGEVGVLNIPIKYNNGKQKLKLWFKGYGNYAPVVDTQTIEINIPNNDYTIEADDVSYSWVIDSLEYSAKFNIYYATILKNDIPQVNKSIKWVFYKGDETIIRYSSTNNNGVAEIPIYLPIGLWKVDIILGYESTNIPTVETHSINMIDVIKKDTTITTNNYSIERNTTNMEEGLFSIILKNNSNELIENGKILFTVKNSTNSTTLYQGYSYTSSLGEAICPYYMERTDNEEDETVVITASYEGNYYNNSTSSEFIVTLPQYEGNLTITDPTTLTTVSSMPPLVLFSQHNLNLTVAFKKSTDEYYDNVWFGKVEQLVNSSSSYYGFNLPSLSTGTYNVQIYMMDPSSTYHAKSIILTITVSETHSIDNYHLNTYAGYVAQNKIGNYTIEITPNVSDPTSSNLYNTTTSNHRKYVKLSYTNEGDSITHSGFTDALGTIQMNYESHYSPDNYNMYIDIYDTYYVNGQKTITASSSSFPTPSKRESMVYLQGLDGSKNVQNIICNTTHNSCDHIVFQLINMNNCDEIYFHCYTNDEGKCYPSFNLSNGKWVIKAFNWGDATDNDWVESMDEVELTVNVPLTLTNSLPIDTEGKIIVTPSEDDEDRFCTFGSDVKFEFRDGLLNVIDYGMLANPDENSGGKIVHNNLKLNTSTIKIECEVKYGNLLNERLNNLEGLLQIRTIENTDVDSDTIDMYSSMVCSPSPVPNNHCYFTRKSEDGIMYYFKETDLDTKYKGVSYIGSPYNQYKGGTDLQTSNAISIFNLENNHSPVLVSNGLIRCAFHKYSGYISIQIYNPLNNTYTTVNTFKLSDNPKLELSEYSDDKIIIKFGDTTWTMRRGHPFVEVKHETTNIGVLNIPNRVYCETSENSRNMTLLQEVDVLNGEFDPHSSVQMFYKDLEVGENVSLKNFQVTDETTGTLSIEYDSITKENAIKLTATGNVGVNLPVDDFLSKPSSTITFSMQNVQGITPSTITLRGFDIPAKIYRDGSSYDVGIYQNTLTPTVTTGTSNSDVTVTFDNIPSTVEYIDFVLNYTSTGTSKFNHLMLNEGDEEIGWIADTSDEHIKRTEIFFDKTYYTNFYNDYDNYGLSIMRPNQASIYLNSIIASPVTVIAPYWKNCKDVDNPKNLIIEYTQGKEQEIHIDWLED